MSKIKYITYTDTSSITVSIYSIQVISTVLVDQLLDPIYSIFLIVITFVCLFVCFKFSIGLKHSTWVNVISYIPSLITDAFILTELECCSWGLTTQCWMAYGFYQWISTFSSLFIQIHHNLFGLICIIIIIIWIYKVTSWSTKYIISLGIIVD